MLKQVSHRDGSGSGVKTAAVIPFVPRSPANAAPVMDGLHCFSSDELRQLHRWYSAMRYAFPGLEAVPSNCPEVRRAALGLFDKRDGGVPKCVVLKEHAKTGVRFFLLAGHATVRGPFVTLAEAIEPQIRAMELPADEAAWHHPDGWAALLTDRMPS